MMKLESTYINESKNSLRLPWLDIAKGIAMVAVVFSHEFASVKIMVLFCNSFMLPLFFMCSGYCISPRKYIFVDYIRKKIQNLLIPYLLLGLLVSFLQVFTNGFNEIINNVMENLFSWQTLWFLPVLFIADIISYYVETKFPISLKILIYSVLFVLAIILCITKCSLPLNIDVVPISIYYLLIGILIKNNINNIHSRYMFISGLSFFLLGVLILCFTKGNLILKLNDIYPLYKIIFSTFESLGILLVLSQFGNYSNELCLKNLAKIIEYIGKNSMVIFAFHMPIFFYCQTFLRPCIDSPILYKMIEFILIWGICFLLIPFMKRYLPLFIGKRNN